MSGEHSTAWAQVTFLGPDLPCGLRRESLAPLRQVGMEAGVGVDDRGRAWPRPQAELASSNSGPPHFRTWGGQGDRGVPFYRCGE